MNVVCSESVISSRKTEIKEFEDFLRTTESSLKSLAETFGWDFQSSPSDGNTNSTTDLTLTCENTNRLKDNNMVSCSINSKHSMPSTSLKKHEEKCRLRKEGYTEDEIESIPPSSKFFYENSSVASVTIDKQTQNAILHDTIMKNQLGTGIRQSLASAEVPSTIDRYLSTFSRTERLAMYEYVVKQGRNMSKKEPQIQLEDLAVDFRTQENEGEKPKSYLELLAEQRDYKRRRQTYRAKNVHITKKSYTEVMREVIENQIKYLEHLRKEDNEEKEVKHETERYSEVETHREMESHRSHEERGEKRGHSKGHHHKRSSSHHSRSSSRHHHSPKKSHHSHRSSKKHKR